MTLEAGDRIYLAWEESNEMGARVFDATDEMLTVVFEDTPVEHSGVNAQITFHFYRTKNDGYFRDVCGRTVFVRVLPSPGAP